MHIYSADCDCAVCSMERFDAHVVEALEVTLECDMTQENAGPKLVKCTKCGVKHKDTCRYWLPVCTRCEKDIEDGDY